VGRILGLLYRHGRCQGGLASSPADLPCACYMATRAPAAAAPTGHESSYSVPVPRSTSVALRPVSVAVSSRRKQIIGAGVRDCIVGAWV
jgi:hypothetical protein